MNGKKLYRAEGSNRKLCGVCGGLAEYFGIDPTIVRVVWVLVSFAWGVGLLAYLVCALVMPRESENTDL